MADERSIWILTAVGVLGIAVCMVSSPARKTVRQIWAVAGLGFREGIRQKIFWTVALLALIPGLLAWFAEGDGTTQGRMNLVLLTCIATGEILGAAIVILLAAVSVSHEIESRIMYTFGVKPINSNSILIGKALGFLGVEVLFLICLAGYTYGLVRTVAMRPADRAGSFLQEDPSHWATMERRWLTTSEFVTADQKGLKSPEGNKENIEQKVAKKSISVPKGKRKWWQYRISSNPNRAFDEKGAVVQFELYGVNPYAAKILADIQIYKDTVNDQNLIYAKSNAPLSQGKASGVFLTKEKISGAESIWVSIGNPSVGNKQYGAIYVRKDESVLLGVPSDGFVMNLFKAFLILAIQGFFLALVTSAWSGVLSFSVVLGFSCILLIGGEFSHYVSDLVSALAAQTTASTNADGETVSTFRPTFIVLERLLLLFPNFKFHGGASGFIEGKRMSWAALAEIVLWVGLIRGIGWALPGLLLFKRREIGC